jgi:hypothetical protein
LQANGPACEPATRPTTKACPDHAVKRRTERYRGRAFRVTRLPRCEHIEAVIASNPAGETNEQARKRLDGIAVCSGSFHHPRTMSVADFLQKDGEVVSAASTGRWFFAVTADGQLDICGDYPGLKGKPGVSAVALGQRLVPLYRDGFSKAFMNRVTDRMALGLSRDSIYIVEGRSDIWRLAEFMQKRLPCTIAINSDGGHVVRGRSPVHVVFRWRRPAAQALPRPAQQAQQTSPSQGRT